MTPLVTITPELAENLTNQLRSRYDSQSAFSKVRSYLAGDHGLPYMPDYRVENEYREVARRSVSNWLPLVSDTFTKRLFVEGYRPTDTLDNSDPWDYWQANKLDARQTIVHRGAIEYGTSYVLVLPGKMRDQRVPYIKPLSPLRSMAWYQDPDDEYPEVAIQLLGRSVDGAEIVEIYDDTNVYTFTKEAPYSTEGLNGGAGPSMTVTPDWTNTATKEHGLNVVPFVRFRERLDDRPYGAIFPLLEDQDRINEITFAIHMALQFGVFRQRWATGLAIPQDEAGHLLEPFKSGIDRLWVSEDQEARFGDFAQTSIADHLQAYTQAVKTFAAHAQIDPNMLTGDVINVSSEALGSLQDSTTQQLAQYKMIFGESWEQVFRLAALAAGDTTAASDLSAQTRWRDDTSHEFLTTVQGLGALVTTLQVPAEALWTKVPGMSDQDIQAWKEAAENNGANDPMAQLLADLQKQATTPPVTPPAATEVVPNAKPAAPAAPAA